MKRKLISMDFKFVGAYEGMLRYDGPHGVYLMVPDGADYKVFCALEDVKCINKPLNERIRSFRTSRKWTQFDLANKAGVTQGEISAIERGVSEPGIKVIRKLQKAFNLDIQFFA